MNLRPLLLVSVLAASAAARAQSTPAAQWTLDAVDSRAVAASGPLGRPGEIVGSVKSAPGKIGGAAAFQVDPVGQIILPLDLAGLKTGVFTLAFWVRPQGRSDPYGTCVDAGGAKGFVLRLSNSSRVGLSTGGKWNVLVAEEKLIEGVWTHVALSYDGAQFRLYSNGKPVGALNPDQPPRFAPELQLGAVTERTKDANGTVVDKTAKALQGDLDQVVVYDRVLSPAEVAALATSAR